MNDQDTPHKQGYDVGRQDSMIEDGDFTQDANPYKQFSEEWWQWEDGWQAGYEDETQRSEVR